MTVRGKLWGVCPAAGAWPLARAAVWLAGLAALWPTATLAQTHYVKKPETVVRAVGVYEWTGDLAKPAASRLVPVTLYIDGHLEDAGVYLARPVPMALETGTVFELDKAGVPQGLLDLSFARHLQPVADADQPYDDGWFGYGQYKAMAAPKPVIAPKKIRQSKTVVESSKPDTARPDLSNAESSTASASDSDRPVMRRRDDSSSGSGSKASNSGSGSSSSGTASSTGSGSAQAGCSPTSSGSGTTESNDSNRPTLSRRDGSGGCDATASSGATTSSGGSPTASTSKTSDSAAANDPDRPTLSRRDGSAGSGSSSGASTASPSDAAAPSASSDSTRTAPDDPDRPTLTRRDGSGSSSGAAASSGSDSGSGSNSGSASASSDDPDRPTLSRRQGSGSSGTDTAGNSGTPADDPDRPTLRKRTPAAQKAARDGEMAPVSAVGSLNDDPNRPTLHRGRPVHPLTDADFPKLTGLPIDVQQMAAVSDAVNRPMHDFSRPWESTAEHDEVLAKMQEMARAKLLAYLNPAATSAAAVAGTGQAGGAPKTAPAQTPAARAAAARAAAQKKKVAAAPAPLPLTDEVLKGYTLSYGGAPTFAYSASSAAPDGSVVRYVTVVAQEEGPEELKQAFANVTDSKHLDRTPRYRLVDVVDADASNRASLLFELRAQGSRSFALYRVIGAQAEQIFASGSTQ